MIYKVIKLLVVAQLAMNHTEDYTHRDPRKELIMSE